MYMLLAALVTELNFTIERLTASDFELDTAILGLALRQGAT